MMLFAKSLSRTNRRLYRHSIDDDDFDAFPSSTPSSSFDAASFFNFSALSFCILLIDSSSISAQSPTPICDCLRQYFVSSCSFLSALFSSVCSSKAFIRGDWNASSSSSFANAVLLFTLASLEEERTRVDTKRITSRRCLLLLFVFVVFIIVIVASGRAVLRPKRGLPLLSLRAAANAAKGVRVGVVMMIYLCSNKCALISDVFLHSFHAL